MFSVKGKLQKNAGKDIEGNSFWIFLSRSFETISARIKNRKEHFMPEVLLQSQFETLEEPDYGIKLDIEMSPRSITEKIINKLQHES